MLAIRVPTMRTAKIEIRAIDRGELFFFFFFSLPPLNIEFSRPERLIFKRALSIGVLQFKEHIFKRGVALDIGGDSAYNELSVFYYCDFIAELFCNLENVS